VALSPLCVCICACDCVYSLICSIILCSCMTSEQKGKPLAVYDAILNKLVLLVVLIVGVSSCLI